MSRGEKREEGGNTGEGDWGEEREDLIRVNLQCPVPNS